MVNVINAMGYKTLKNNHQREWPPSRIKTPRPLMLLAIVHHRVVKARPGATCKSLPFAALLLALAGCFECRPGDTRTTNHSQTCEARR